jgi:hypothetical protein
VNLRNYGGKVAKTATVYSNDPQNPRLTLKMEGSVLPIIDVKPSSTVIFRGMADQVHETVLDLRAGPMPFHISSITSSLDDKVAYELETVEAGKHYRLRVSNKLKRGQYSGYIRMDTDLAQKPELVIRVGGNIEGDISVRPQTVLVGKLSANLPERQGRIVVTSNRDMQFHITKVDHDEQLVSISTHPLENGKGYVIEVNPKLETVPAGSRRQTSLEIETDITPGQKDVVQVHVFNSAQSGTKALPR